MDPQYPEGSPEYATKCWVVNPILWLLFYVPQNVVDKCHMFTNQERDAIVARHSHMRQRCSVVVVVFRFFRFAGEFRS